MLGNYGSKGALINERILDLHHSDRCIERRENTFGIEDRQPNDRQSPIKTAASSMPNRIMGWRDNKVKVFVTIMACSAILRYEGCKARIFLPHFPVSER